MLISIAMPVYNGEKTIKRALLSILNQTYNNFECIVVDDGSTDNTLEIIKKFNDPRIKVIVLPKNMGRAYARQVALEAAKGQFLAMLDADDWYYSDKLKQQLAAFEKYPEIVAVSGGMISVKGDIAIGVRGKGDEKIQILKCPLNLSFPHGPAMIKMEEAKKHGYNNKLELGEDTDFLMRVLHKKKYLLLNDILYSYSEWDSVNEQKVIKGYLLLFKRDKQWLKKYPFKTLLSFLQTSLKILFVKIFFSLGLFDKYLRKRSKEISDYELQKYKEELYKLKSINY